MTKSQNKKNEQQKDLCIAGVSQVYQKSVTGLSFSIKQNEKSFTQKDLSLTELWQKGELKDGEYYCRTTHDSSVRKHYLSNIDNENMIEILAPVPTFDEWKASEKYNKHLEEVIKVYERKDKQATETSIAYNELAQENEELKELLKDARNVLKMVDTYYGDYDSTKGFLIVERIDEVLK